jgi:PHP family Zn ribbon phosphoesterase
VGVKRVLRKLFGKRKKIHPANPVFMTCPKCGGSMKVVAFLTEHAVVDRIMEHLKLTFVTAKPPPPQVALQELLMAADPPAEYFS